MKEHEEGTVTLRAFARILGNRSPSYITQLKGEGRLVLTDDGKRVRVAESLARVRDTADPAKVGVVERHAAARGADNAPTDGADGDSEQGDSPTGPTDSHASRRSRALADKAEWDAKAAQRDFEISIGALMPADQVTAAVADATTGLRTRLEALPYDLAPRLASVIDEGQVRALLTEEIEHVLAELSRQFAALARSDP